MEKSNGLMELDISFEGELTESRRVADGEGASVWYTRECSMTSGSTDRDEAAETILNK